MTSRFVARILKVVFLVSTLSFLLIQIQIRRSATPIQDDPSHLSPLPHNPPRRDGKVAAGEKIITVNAEINPGGSGSMKVKKESNSRPEGGGGGSLDNSRPSPFKLAQEPLPKLEINNLTGGFTNQRDHHPPVPPAHEGSNAAKIGKEGESPSAGQSSTSAAVNGLTKPSVADIRKSVEYNNLNAEILNLKKFGPLASSNLTSVIVVQVHNRSNYLEKLVESLSTAKGIESTLIIFSHDFYSHQINQIIRKISFARVMQIFYPYSIQLFPDKFPGQNPRDCPPDLKKDLAKSQGCLNWEWPDKYGHYRVAKFTQIKHHWWWKMNYVMEGINELKSFDGWVLLLEEDHFLSPDALYVLDHITSNKQKLCAECGVISLGFYLKSYASYGNNIGKLAVYPWFSSRHNMGMALNRFTWNRIRNCSKLFCKYDDYNWDWSLMRVNMECLKPNKLTVIYAKAPRVFHIGDCGVHHKCHADTSAQKVAKILEGVKGSLFPSKLIVSERSKRMLRPPKENGGWGDIRDHALCLNNTRFPT